MYHLGGCLAEIETEIKINTLNTLPFFMVPYGSYTFWFFGEYVCVVYVRLNICYDESLCEYLLWHPIEDEKKKSETSKQKHVTPLFHATNDDTSIDFFTEGRMIEEKRRKKKFNQFLDVVDYLLLNKALDFRSITE